MKQSELPSCFRNPWFRFWLWICLMGLSGPGGALASGTVSSCTETALRAALVGGGTVTFACDGTITLAGVLTITNDTQLDARGRSVTLSGSNTTRVLNVQSNVTLVIRSVTVANGRAQGGYYADIGAIPPGYDGVGGGIANTGTLQLLDCSLVSNSVAGPNGSNAGATKYPFSGYGGAVYNVGILLASNCSFSLNQATGGAGGNDLGPLPGAEGAGGAIFNAGSATVLRSSLGQNAVVGGAGGTPVGGLQFGTYGGAGGAGRGGALYSAGGLIVSQSTFASNSAAGGLGANAVTTTQTGPAGSAGGTGGGGFGGAIYQASSNATVTASAFNRNSALGGFAGSGSGGAGWVISRPAPVGGNGGVGGEGRGGGVYAAGAIAMTNNTLFDNRCAGGNGGNAGNGGYCNPPSGGNTSGAAGGNGGTGGKGQGGGIFVDGPLSVSLNNTIASNRGTGGQGGGGGLGGAGCVPLGNGANGQSGAAGSASGVNITVNPGGSLRLINTIVANGNPGTNCFGTILDGGHNICSDSSGNFTNVSSRSNTDPKLGSWGNYGGPTPTLRLLGASPALDAGDDAISPASDQRGIARPFGWHGDIGAFEAIPDFWQITSSERGPGTLRLRGLGSPNSSFSAQATSDFLNWTNRSTNTVAPDGRFDTQFSADTNGVRQFYRTKAP